MTIQLRMDKGVTLALIAALFGLPLVASMLMYGTGWRPGGTMNHGELIEPARTVADIRLRTSDGGPLHFKELRGKWTLVYFGRVPCVQVCEHSLYKMRQVRLAQGEKAERVQRLFVVLAHGGQEMLRAVIEPYPGMWVVTGPDAGLQALVREFALPVGTPLDRLERIYVVDPVGRLMMSYPPDADASGMRKDLARLLRVSQIG